MAQFLKDLTEKLLDFFNVGRLVSIFIPGVLVSFALLMLLSLLLFPRERSIRSGGAATPAATNYTSAKATPGVKGGANATRQTVAAEEKNVVQKVQLGSVETKTGIQMQFTSALTKAVVHMKLTSAVAKQVAVPVKVTVTFSGSAASADQQNRLQEVLSRQMVADFNRVARHHWIVILLSVVTGILLYEVGSIIIASSSGRSKAPLRRYKEVPAPTELTFTPDTSDEAKVGLIYFAPFLKEKFSGEENYYNFVISEYYRFLEFSAVMPISTMIAVSIAFIYYIVACLLTRSVCSYGAAITVLVVIALAMLAFHEHVFKKVLENYCRSTHDLIKGITDVMNKSLVK